MTAPKNIPVGVKFEPNFLQAIDKEAKKMMMNRQSFMRYAIAQHLERLGYKSEDLVE